MGYEDPRLSKQSKEDLILMIKLRREKMRKFYNAPLESKFIGKNNFFMLKENKTWKKDSIL